MRNIPAELVKRYEAAGWWTRDTIGHVLARGLQAAPDATFRVHSDVRPWAGTFADVELVARRLAAGLRERGVGPGDVVALQLPNWMEAAAAFWASAFLGAVIVPIVHFYGRKELTHILGTAKPRVFITAEEFGRMEYQPDLCADVADRRRGRRRDFDDLLADEPHGRHPRRRPGRPGPDRLHLRHHQRPEGRRPQPSDAWASRPASCWRTTRPTAAASSPRPRSATSSACSAPS